MVTCDFGLIYVTITANVAKCMQEFLKTMSALTLKRLIVIAISQVLGFVIGVLIISVGFDMLPFVSSIQTPQGRSIAEYGVQYFFWTFFPIGVVVMIWMDAFLDTKILPD
jgi:hypothetical protein